MPTQCPARDIRGGGMCCFYFLAPELWAHFGGGPASGCCLHRGQSGGFGGKSRGSQPGRGSLRPEGLWFPARDGARGQRWDAGVLLYSHGVAAGGGDPAPQNLGLNPVRGWAAMSSGAGREPGWAGSGGRGFGEGEKKPGKGKTSQERRGGNERREKHRRPLLFSCFPPGYQLNLLIER